MPLIVIVQTSDEGVGPQIATREQIEAAEAADHRERVAQLERRARSAISVPLHRIKPPSFLDCVAREGLLQCSFLLLSNGQRLLLLLSLGVCSPTGAVESPHTHILNMCYRTTSSRHTCLSAIKPLTLAFKLGSRRMFLQGSIRWRENRG